MSNNSNNDIHSTDNRIDPNSDVQDDENDHINSHQSNYESDCDSLGNVESDSFHSDFNYDTSEYIRRPDEIVTERLVDDENNDLYPDTNVIPNYDFEKQLENALKISEHTYKLENDEEGILRQSLEEYDIQINQQELFEQSIMDERRKSLEFFVKRLTSLSFGSQQTFVNAVKEKLEEYFNLFVDIIYLDQEIYNELYKIIDSYYIIPVEKGQKKTAIAKEEDELLRVLLLKKEK